MFFILSKILAFLLSPVTWIFVLMGFAIFAKDPARKRRYFIISVVALYFFMNTFVIASCMRLWEISTPQPPPGGKYECAIVLGGMIRYDAEHDRPQFLRGSDRLFQVLPLLRKGVVKKIIITSGSGNLFRQNEKEADILKKYLVSAGFPDSCIISENQSRNTYENAIMTRAVMDELNIKDSVLFVTSAFHMRRATACFAKAGITKLVPYPADKFSGPVNLELDYFLLPNSEALLQWELLLHEIVGYFVYKIKGYC